MERSNEEGYDGDGKGRRITYQLCIPPAPDIVEWIGCAASQLVRGMGSDRGHLGLIYTSVGL